MEKVGFGVLYIFGSVLFILVGFFDDYPYEINIIWIITGIISFIIGVLVIKNSQLSNEQAEEFRKKKLDTLKLKYKKEKLSISQEIISTDDLVCGIDEENKKVCFFNYVKNDRFEGNIYSYKDILEVELIVDGETITKTSRSSQIGGAILGSVVAGGVGAIIGGVSGKTSSKEKISKIQLKIIVNETKNPYKIITFLDMPVSTDKNDPKIKEANKLTTHWHSLFKVIIEKADIEDRSKSGIENSAISIDAADEIRKLFELYKEGILTKAEFELQKKKIIS